MWRPKAVDDPWFEHARQRSEADYIAVYAVNQEDCRRLLVSLAHEECTGPVPSELELDLGRHSSRSGCPNDGDETQIGPPNEIADASNRLGAENRVSAQREEVVKRMDVRDREHIRPDLAQRLLKEPAPRTLACRWSPVHHEAEAISERHALHLAGRAFRYLVDDYDPARHLERRNCLRHEVLQLALVRSALAPQHDRGEDLFAQPGVRNAEGDCLGDVRVAQEHFVELEGETFSPARLITSLSLPSTNR